MQLAAKIKRFLLICLGRSRQHTAFDPITSHDNQKPLYHSLSAAFPIIIFNFNALRAADADANFLRSVE
jgi:hypothetical protein